MAGIYKVGKFYYIYCRYRGRRYRWSTGLTSKDAAKRMLLDVEMRLAEGKAPWLPEGAALAELAESYLKHNEGRVAPGTLADRRRYLKRFMAYFGADRPITEISRQDAMAYKAERGHAGGASASLALSANVVINRELAAVRHYFNYAVDRGACKDNPFKRFGALPEPEREPRILSQAEAETWFTWCRNNDPLLYDLSVIAFYSGLRPSDTKKIRGGDVNVTKRILTVNVSKLRGAKILMLPLHDRALAVLRRRKRKHGNEYLFPGREGGHVSSFRRHVNEAREATGLNDFTFGQFRHNCATWLIAAKVNIYTVKELLGHASVKTTERYAKLIDKTRREGVEALPAFGDDDPGAEK